MNRAFKAVANISHQREKLEMSAEVVELGIAEDIKKASAKSSGLLKKANAQSAKTEKKFNEYNAEWEKANTLKKDIEAELKKAESSISAADKAAKDLGVSPSNISGYKELKGSIDGLFKASNDLKYPSIR